MQALSFYTPIYPKKSGSVRNNGPSLREGHAKDKVNVFVLRSVFYVQLPRLRVLAHRKYRRPRSCPHLIGHIFGARITLILLFASLFN